MTTTLKDNLTVNYIIHERFTSFDGIYYVNHKIFKDWAQAIEFVEFLQSFSKNQLNVNKLYVLYKRIEFKVSKQNNEHFLLLIEKKDDVKIYFSKLECNIISHKVNRIISRCRLGEIGE